MIATITPLIRRGWLAALVGFSTAAAAENGAWFVQAWQVADGLPNNNVSGLAQSRDGYLWLALPDGVARFDGVQFERFAPEAFAAKNTHRVRTLLRASDDTLWIAIDSDGVIAWRRESIDVFAPATNARAESLLEDRTGAVWATFGGADIRRIKDGSVRLFTAADGLPPGPRSSLAFDTQGRVWLARGGVLGLLRETGFEPRVQTGNGFTRIAAAATGGIWVAAGFTLSKYDERSGLVECGTFEPPGVAGETATLIEDRTGAVWLGTTLSGVMRYDGMRFEPVPVSDREIRCLLEDRDGNIWIGTAGGGVNRVKPRAIVLERVGDEIAAESLQSVCEDRDGGLWAATSNGLLARRIDGRWRTVGLEADPALRDVTCVASDPRGGVWIGTMARALHRWQNGQIETWREEDGLGAHSIRALQVSPNGDVWIGEEGPALIQRLRNGKLETLRAPANASHFRTMAPAPGGDVWIGADKGRLLRATTQGEIVDESARIVATGSAIRCLLVGPDDTLWIGFSGRGVGRLRHGRFALVGTAEGLFHDDISQIVADDRGNLWFGCDRGLFRVRQSELDDVADGRAASVRSIAYGRDQGLPPLQAKYGQSPGALRSRDGRLWIPMRSGLAVVDPSRLQRELPPPGVLIRRISVDDALVAIDRDRRPAEVPADSPMNLAGVSQLKLALRPGHHHVTFAFTAPMLSAPENVEFRYRLDGFDADWSAATTERIATFPRLDPGTYQFRVAARNRAGAWTENVAKVAFSVKPQVWQRGWFRLAVVALFTGAVVAIVRYVSFRRLREKVRRLQEQAALDRERARIARDIHDDVGGRLTRIMLLSGLALRERTEPTKAVARVQEIATTARQVIRSLDETVWAINPRNDTLPDLINYLGQFAVEFLHTAEIPCRVELPDHPPRQLISAEARHNLFLAAKEALNNIVRHAGPCEVVLRIEPRADVLAVTIVDTGCGFVAGDGAPEADGLRNMRRRLAEIGGECGIEAEPGRGTCVRLVFPWPVGMSALRAATAA